MSFSKEPFEDLGYNIETMGEILQWRGNLSKYPYRNRRGLPATVMNKQDGLKPQFVPRVR